MVFYKRTLKKKILKSLKEMPAVFLNGPRQAGKSTLAQEIAEQIGADYISFDEISVVAAASSDPEAFVNGFTKPVIIDEVQLVPQIFRPLKRKIDALRLSRKKSNGLFLLTGSTNILTLPNLSDALVGRMSIATLMPISSGEFYNSHKNFIKHLFSKDLSFQKDPFDKVSIEKIISKTTFPQISANSSIDSSRWFENYISTLISRDIKSISEITKSASLVNMLKILASRAGGLLNNASLTRELSLKSMTFLRYKALLSAIFLISELPPWHNNLSKRLVKSPKVFFTDTLLLCHLLGFDLNSAKNQEPQLFGKIVENFVYSELTKQLGSEFKLYHFRTSDNKEVDFIIERSDKMLIGVEVKSSTSVTEDDFKGLKTLEMLSSKHFVKGIVLYRGRDIIPFGKKLFAMPISSIWNLGVE